MRARADSLRARAGVRVHDSFGRALLSASRFEAPRSVDELRALFARASAEGMPLTLRGAGRSYGDASLNTPGLVVDGR
ncbi:MAG: FAD-binding protein, partial [Deltaproteobacteria bacterium]|nr:FAD-binding protein [Deltaproteobacteria bacterium]